MQDGLRARRSHVGQDGRGNQPPASASLLTDAGLAAIRSFARSSIEGTWQDYAENGRTRDHS